MEEIRLHPWAYRCSSRRGVIDEPLLLATVPVTRAASCINFEYEPTPSGSTFTRGSTLTLPYPSPRTLVLCFDGTGDQFDADNTNIVQFCSTLKKDDKNQQMVYYQSGVGTCTVPEVVTPVRAAFQKLLNMAIANHLDAHIMGTWLRIPDGKLNDKICILGFSRGAYTARALAGMIHKVGLLPAGNSQQVPFAYQMYTQDDEEGWKQSRKFKDAFSIDVAVEFLGVWDTVCSVGFIPRDLPFTASNTAVRYFRHALALDERRATFQVNHWHRRLGYNHDNEERPQTDVREVWFADVGGGSVPNETENSLARIPLRWMILECFRTGTGIRFRKGSLKRIGMDQDTLESFTGGHFIIERVRSQMLTSEDTFTSATHPGPASATEQPRGEICQDDDLKGIDIDQGPLNSIGKTSGLSIRIKEVSPPTGALAFKPVQERKDALSPIYDQLNIWRAWWLPEIIPLRHRLQSLERSLRKHYWSVNIGHPRKILKPVREGEKILVHRSVDLRMRAAESELGGRKYKPRAEFNPLEIEWVD
ncbi:hypothetical protein EDB85DRAFT_1886281 [Lactarius pseudohatsudake]|nr:hypothetical protein EDB85DRAFT_1886281 [Lactarius pseudohatsudake]